MSRHLTEKKAYNEPNICHYQMWKFKPNIENNIHYSVSHIPGYSKVNVSGLQYLRGGGFGICCFLPFGHWEWGWRGCLIPPRDMVYICIYYVISCFAYIRPSDEQICRLSVFSCLSTKSRNNKSEILGKNFEKVTGTEI